MKQYLYSLIAIPFLLLSGCAKEKDIVADAFLITMLSATIESDTIDNGAIVNLHVFLEADKGVQIDSMGVVLRTTEGEFKYDSVDANTFRVASMYGEQRPGFFSIPIHYGANEYQLGFRNFAVYAYSKGVPFQTRAVSLSRLRRANDLGNVAYYPFDNSEEDAFGRFPLTKGNLISYQPGHTSVGFDQAISFDVGHLHNPIMDDLITGTSARTFSFFFNASTSGIVRVLSYGDGTAGEFSILLDPIAGNVVLYNGSNAIHYSGSISIGSWHKVFVAIPENARETQIRVFLDENLLSTSEATSTIVNTSNSNGVWVGSGIGGLSEASGLKIDDLRIWNRRLSRLAVELIRETD